jgi:hypothetical protein
MAVLQIPVRSDLDAYEFQIDLDGKTYLLRFRYNSRMNLWHMDVCRVDATEILAGIPLLTNCDLIGRYNVADRPPGDFLAYDESGGAKNAGRDDLGADVVLLYIEEGT